MFKILLQNTLKNTNYLYEKHYECVFPYNYFYYIKNISLVQIQVIRYTF